MAWLPGALTSGNNRILIGYDLGDDFCRISYVFGEAEPVTVSAIAGAEQYSIPTVLCKREGANQWFFGREAVTYAHESGGIMVDSLLQKAVDGEPVLIDGKSYQPISLLTLFLKRSLSLLGQFNITPDKIDALLVTSANMDKRHTEVIREAVGELHLHTDKLFFQSYTESYYHYMIRQSGDVWYKGSLLLEHTGESIVAYRMEANLRTQPTVVYISESEHPFPSAPRTNTPEMEYELGQMDKQLTNLLREICAAGALSSVFLIGERFSNQWMKESLQFLCSNYRVFQGNNLYSKGAVFGLLDRLDATPTSKNFIFLGGDKLTANVGMNIMRQGENIYFAILDAGTNWMDASESFDFYLQDGNSIEFRISSLIGGGERIAKITLEDYSGALSRMRATLYLPEANLLAVEIEDLGMGNFRSSTHKVWKELIDLS